MSHFGSTPPLDQVPPSLDQVPPADDHATGSGHWPDPQTDADGDHPPADAGPPSGLPSVPFDTFPGHLPEEVPEDVVLHLDSIFGLL